VLMVFFCHVAQKIANYKINLAGNPLLIPYISKLFN
jgi:hypothetical protein